MTLVSFRLFRKIWATCKNFLGKWFTAPPPPRQKNARTPMIAQTWILARLFEYPSSLSLLILDFICWMVLMMVWQWKPAIGAVKILAVARQLDNLSANSDMAVALALALGLYKGKVRNVSKTLSASLHPLHISSNKPLHKVFVVSKTRFHWLWIS